VPSRASLALKSDGSIVGWGNNLDSSGNWIGQATPPDGNSFIAIAAGYAILSLLNPTALSLPGAIIPGENAMSLYQIPILSLLPQAGYILLVLNPTALLLLGQK